MTIQHFGRKSNMVLRAGKRIKKLTQKEIDLIIMPLFAFLMKKDFALVMARLLRHVHRPLQNLEFVTVGISYFRSS